MAERVRGTRPDDLPSSRRSERDARVPNGNVWHLSCVRIQIRQVRESFQGEAFPLVRALYRQRVRELRAYFGMGGSSDVPEVISDEEK